MNAFYCRHYVVICLLERIASTLHWQSISIDLKHLFHEQKLIQGSLFSIILHRIFVSHIPFKQHRYIPTYSTSSSNRTESAHICSWTKFTDKCLLHHKSENNIISGENKVHSGSKTAMYGFIQFGNIHRFVKYIKFRW